MHKFIFKIIFNAALLCLLLSTSLHAEFVFFHDGTIVEGTITADAADSITLYTKDKQVKKIYRSQIMRILYTEFKMSRVYVQKRDGQGFAAYLVDEDRASYIFRKELYKPEEFTVKREEVLFMAEKNPSGLKGESTTTSVDLTWLPPYDAVRKYNIYVSQNEGTGYVLAESTFGKSGTVKKLKSNSTYYFLVKSVDADGYESGPSNELEIRTLNLPPEKFEISRVEKLPGGGYSFEWNEASDPDGKVSGYRIYRKNSGRVELAAETKKRSHTISADERIGYLYITAVDDLKAESDLIRVHNPLYPEMRLSVNPAFLFTAGRLGDLSGYGFGAVLKLEISNYFFPGFELSPELSVFSLAVKDDFTEPESSINSLILLPLMMTAGYAFYPVDNLAIIPAASFGVITSFCDYTYFDIPDSKERGAQKRNFDPAAGAGLTVRYSLTENISLNAGVDYRIFFENDGSMYYFTCLLGAGIKF